MRPRIQTYGESIGEITNEVFGLTADATDFHVTLAKIVDRSMTLEAIESMKLNARYRAQVNKYLSEQRTTMLMLHAAGTAIFSEFLQRSSAALVAPYGRNDWRVALLRTLAADPAFCAAPERYLGPPPAA